MVSLRNREIRPSQIQKHDAAIHSLISSTALSLSFLFHPCLFSSRHSFSLSTHPFPLPEFSASTILTSYCFYLNFVFCFHFLLPACSLHVLTYLGILVSFLSIQLRRNLLLFFSFFSFFGNGCRNGKFRGENHTGKSVCNFVSDI